MTIDTPGVPGAPIEVTTSVPTITICSPSVSSTPLSCAMNITATDW